MGALSRGPVGDATPKRDGMNALSEPYVIGLLTDLEYKLPQLQADMQQSRVRAQAVDAQLRELLLRMDASKQQLLSLEGDLGSLAQTISEKNAKVSSLHQEIAGLTRRAEDIKTEMERVGPGAIAQRLRRERAKVLVQIEDREKLVLKNRSEVESARAELQKTEHLLAHEKDCGRILVRELDQLQSQLPRPHLYVELAEVQLGLAHCQLFLDNDGALWQKNVRQALTWVDLLHRELRLGKYRLDANSDLIGGRTHTSSESVYVAVALGDVRLAQSFFNGITAPDLFFHQIFNVFRLWCLGLYVQQRFAELRQLLQMHLYAEGVRGFYAQSFDALLRRHPEDLRRALNGLLREEFKLWQTSGSAAFGVVCVPVLALRVLASHAGMALELHASNLPRALLSAKSKSV